jgi:hypothetical protein
MPDSDELKSSDKKQLVKRFRECYRKAVEADDSNRRAAISNIKFARVPGSQWDEQTKTDRGNDRLMLEFNQTKVQCKRVINEMRANRPQEKVRGYEDNDKDTAEVYEGLIRNIWNVSDGDSIADYQSEYQVYGGYGVFKLETDYSSDTAFDQDLRIANVANPFCVWSDPAAKDMLKRDADWWIETEKIKKTSFKSRWPKAEKIILTTRTLTTPKTGKKRAMTAWCASARSGGKSQPRKRLASCKTVSLLTYRRISPTRH